MTRIRLAGSLTGFIVGAMTVAGVVTSGIIRVRAQSPAEPVTFTKDVAPIIFDRCAGCHRPDGPAPFSLLTYSAVRQRATQIAAVTKSRFMPPWKSEPGYGEFIGQHPLTDTEIGVIERWATGGTIEGNPGDLPAPPRLTDGWQLGKPDLIVTLPKPYELQAEGTDVFHIFVIPLPVDGTRYVKGVEFLPGNPKVVHHANIRIDTTPASRQLDDQDPGPGYEGLLARSADYPDGHFLGWTPGQVTALLPKGLAWPLARSTDLIVELHMRPSGKPEVVAPSVGLFFGDDPPDRTPAMLRLGRQSIDILPGDKNYAVEDSYVLPVDVEVQAVQPHAHYRAREVRGIATLPDGTSKWLIYIKDWDFRWQHVYRFVTPFTLPKGTTVAMRYTYDNSADNPRNPQFPPQRAIWGQRSSDEMGDLWIQVLTRDERDRRILKRSFGPKASAEDAVGYESRIQADPTNVGLHDDVALLYLGLKRDGEAVAHFQASARLKPESAATHFNLGTALLTAGRLDEALGQFQMALRINPDYGLVHNNLGIALLQSGNANEALSHFAEALRIDPTNAEAHFNMARTLRSRGNLPEAIEQFRQVAQLKPDSAPALANLAWLLATAPVDRLRDANQAISLAERAVDLTDRRESTALDVLAAAYAAAGFFDRAVEAAESALRLAPPGPALTSIRARQELYKRHRPYLSPVKVGVGAQLPGSSDQ